MFMICEGPWPEPTRVKSLRSGTQIVKAFGHNKFLKFQDLVKHRYGQRPSFKLGGFHNISEGPRALTQVPLRETRLTISSLT